MVASTARGGGASAESVIAARSATWRAVNAAGEGRTAVNSRRPRIAPIQRRNEIQLPLAVSPTRRHGLTRSRAAAIDCPSTPKSTSASAIAPAENSRNAITPRGTTWITAAHARHKNRRIVITTTTGFPTGSSGPRLWRSRTPCPHSPSPRPAGRAAASHRGHCPGRASSTDGILSSHPLTSSPP
jgi:hypothetical protein